MSDLIGHIKVMRALAVSYHASADRMNACGLKDVGDMLKQHAFVHTDAANMLEDIAKAEASGPSYEDRPQPGRKP